MNSTKLCGRLVATIVLCFIVSGCASFKGNQLPEVRELSPLPAGTQKPDAIYSFSSGVDFGGKREHRENVRKVLEAEFVEVLRESGYIASLTEGTEGKDIYIKAYLLNSGNPAAMIPAVITGLSLYTIPSWATDKFHVTVNVITTDRKQHSYSLTDTTTLVQWLPMMFAFPFHNPKKVPVEVRKNMYKNLILRMQEDGVLPKPSEVGDTRSIILRVNLTSVA